MLLYSTHFLFISLIIRKIFNFILSDQLEKLFNVYIIVVRNIKHPTSFHFFALKTDNSLFCHRDIPTIHVRNGIMQIM